MGQQGGEAVRASLAGTRHNDARVMAGLISAGLVLIGALITAVLFIAGKTLIGIYMASADVASAYGAAGSVVILILWVYYSAQIFFYGSLFTHEYAMKLGSRADASDRESIPGSGLASKEKVDTIA